MFVLLIVFPKPKCCNAFFSFFSPQNDLLTFTSFTVVSTQGCCSIIFFVFLKRKYFFSPHIFFRAILASLLPNPLIKATLLGCLKKDMFSSLLNVDELSGIWSSVMWCSPHNYPVKTIWRLKLKFLFFIFHLTLE